MNTAKLLKDNLPKFNGHAALYEMTPPLGEHRFVIASAVTSWAFETYLFGANDSGEVVEWSELEGSTKGTTDHRVALFNAGYEIQESPPLLENR